MGNIYNHNRTPFKFIIDRSEYWDFYLYQSSFNSEYNENGIYDKCLISYIDITDSDCVWFDKLYSKYQYYWDNAVNNGITLKNIGYTGVDNGLINYQKDRTSNSEFLKLFKDSEINIEKDDFRLTLSKVKGNNMIFTYDNDIVEEDGILVSKLNGGFFQGFFKTDDDYKILPDDIGNGITFEVVLKRHDFDSNGETLNDRYSSNKGIFLYLGTRAENKWWKEYETDLSLEKSKNGYLIDGYVNNPYLDSNSLNDNYIKSYNDIYAVNEYFSDGYFTDKCDERQCCCKTNDKNTAIDYKSSFPKFTYPEFLNTYEDNSVWFTNDGKLWIENEKFTTNFKRNSSYPNIKSSVCDCKHYFDDKYISNDYYSDSCDCSMYVKEDYINNEEFIDINEELITSDGYSVRQPNIKEYVSDNKFLLFDRTCDGFTTENWIEGSETIITDIQTPDIENYFLLFNRTCNGYTTDTIANLESKISKKYDVLKDLYKNALAFQIKDDGRIGYKYLIKDCDNDSGYSIESEWSVENSVTDDLWNTVTIKIEPISKPKYNTQCAKIISNYEKMRITIYVNGKLRLISKELPMLNLRKLDDVYSKQEGVPFNMSLGGGTQGLCDVIYLNYRELPKYVLPIEKEFAGTFIGYIKTLRIHDCALSLSQIRQNSIFDTTF